MQEVKIIYTRTVEQGRADVFTYEDSLQSLANMDYPNLNKANRLIAEAKEAGIQFTYPTYTHDGNIDFRGVCFGISYFWLRNEILKSRKENESITLGLIYGKGSHFMTMKGTSHPIKKAVLKAIDNETSVEIIKANETAENPELCNVTLKYYPHIDPLWKSHGFQQTLHWLHIDDKKEGININDANETQNAYCKKVKAAASLKEIDMILIAMMRENIIVGSRILNACIKKLDELGEHTYIYDICRSAVRRTNSKSMQHSIYTRTLDIIARSEKPDFSEADIIFKDANKFGVKFREPVINRKDQIAFKNMSLGEIYFWLRKNFLLVEKEPKTFYLSWTGKIKNVSVQDIIKKAMKDSGLHFKVDSSKSGVMRLIASPAALVKPKEEVESKKAADSTLPVLPPPLSRVKKETSVSPAHSNNSHVSTSSNNSNKENANELNAPHSRLFRKPPRYSVLSAHLPVQATRRSGPG